MEKLVRINYTKRFSPYEDDEKWMDLNNQYTSLDLIFEISEHGDLSIVTNLKNVFGHGITGGVIRNISMQAQGLTPFSIPAVGVWKSVIMQGLDIIDIYYNPESCEDGKYFLDRDCHNACVMVNFKMYDIAIGERRIEHMELRDRIVSSFQCSLYDNNSIVVIETKGNDCIKDKIKKICSLYMCEINDNKRGITIDRWQRFGAVIRYTFTQDEYKYIIEIV